MPISHPKAVALPLLGAKHLPLKRIPLGALKLKVKPLHSHSIFSPPHLEQKEIKPEGNTEHKPQMPLVASPNRLRNSSPSCCYNINTQFSRVHQPQSKNGHPHKATPKRQITYWNRRPWATTAPHSLQPNPYCFHIDIHNNPRHTIKTQQQHKIPGWATARPAVPKLEAYSFAAGNWRFELLFNHLARCTSSSNQV